MGQLNVDMRRTRVHATWWDDEPGKVGRYVPVVEKACGVRISIQAPSDLRHVESKDPYHFVDLDFESPDFDGVSLAKKIVLSNPHAGIVLVSRYLATARYENVDRRIPPTARIAFLDKAEVANAGLKAENSTVHIIEKGVTAVKHAIAAVREQGSTIGAPPTLVIPELEGLDAGDFYGQPKTDQVPHVIAAQSQLKDYLSAVFAAHAEVSWMVIGVPSGEVLRWGAPGDSAPRQKAEIISIGASALSKSVPMVFHRPRYRG